MKQESIYTLISKHFDNECSEQEATFIASWYNESEANKKEFLELKKVWIVSNTEIDEKIEDSKENIWNRIVTGISSVNAYKYTKRTLIYYTSISAAAAILLMLCVNLFVGRYNNNIQYTQMYVPKGEKGQMHLADSTAVWLNSDSKLTLSNGFNSTDRIVELEGEAYFNVTKSLKHKFIVRTGFIDIVVHGTSFNITAYPQSDNISIALQEGSMSVVKSNTGELLAELSPNEKITINKNTFITQRQAFDTDANIAWTFDELIFEHSSLDEVFAKMENWYGINIKVIAPKKDLKYRFKIKSESLNEILKLINKMTPIEYTIDGKEVTVKYI